MRSVLSRLSESWTAPGRSSGVTPRPSRAIALGPSILVATTHSSRRPVRANHSPMISSVRPIVSARTGVVGYISAVSMKVQPASLARSIWAWASSKVFCEPQVMVPRQISLTSGPSRPRGIVFMPCPSRRSGGG